MKSKFILVAAALLLPFLSDGSIPSRLDAADIGSSIPADIVAADGYDNSGWWRSFDCPTLDTLISIGERANYSAVTALRRIDMARAQLQQARSAYFPQIGLSAGWTRERSAGAVEGSHVPAVTTSHFGAAATMSWEIDIFGKVRSRASEAAANVAVSAAEYAGAITALDAEIASTYITLEVDKMQLAVAREHSENQRHIVDITEVRHRTGLASKLDVVQARTLYYSTIASVPLLEASIEAGYNALAVLLGTTPEALPHSVYTDSELPDHYRLAGLDAPLDLLRGRPDIVAAERSIDAAAAALGVARKDYLPSLSVQAAIGTHAHAISDLFKGNSLTYSVAPTLSWTLFDGLSRRAAARDAELQMANAVEAYNNTVLTAVEEVRNSVAHYKASLIYIERIGKVVENSKEAVDLSLDLYKQGLTVFSNVVDAQLNYLTYQNTLVSARGDALNALIALYKALGGGWAGN